MTTHAYTAARYDFGVRKGPTLGLIFHGSESEAGLVGYLSRDPARNVSANFVCEQSGRMVQMLPLDHASGSLNPQDRSSDKAYYGHQHLVDVLGTWWADPNSAVLSVEIEMYAAKGPNAAQVASLIAWSADMRAHFPGIRGALGHADQTDTKGCPGSTPAMKSVFAGIGGHGLFTEADVPLVKYTKQTAIGGTITVHTDAAAIPIEGGDRPMVKAGTVRPVLGSATLPDVGNRLCYLMWVGPQLCWIAASAVDLVANDGPNVAMLPAAANYAVKVTIGGRVKEWTETLP